MIRENKSISLIIVGKIGSCYGIYGWIKIFSFTENPENILNYKPWFIQKLNQWKEIKLENWRKCHHNKNCIIVKLQSVNNRDAANFFTNCEIAIDESQLPLLSEDLYYWKDLINCRVVTIKNYDLGKVIGIIETGSNDVLIIKANVKDAFGIKERLIPFLDGQVIKQVNLIAQTIKVDWDPNFKLS